MAPEQKSFRGNFSYLTLSSVLFSYGDCMICAIYTNLAPAPMLSDGEIGRPLPDEGYRPEKLWAGMHGREEGKTNHPKQVP